METDCCVREFCDGEAAYVCSSHKGNLWQTKGKIVPKSNLNEWDFIEATYRVRIAQKQLYHWQANPSQARNHKSCFPRAFCITCSNSTNFSRSPLSFLLVNLPLLAFYNVWKSVECPSRIWQISSFPDM